MTEARSSLTLLDRVGLMAFIVVLIIAGISAQALAHTDEDYWTDGGIWSDGDVAYDMTVGVPGGLGSGQHDAIARGGQKWNALTNAITFKRSGDEVTNFPFSEMCSHPNAIHWKAISALASVDRCYNILSTRIVRFGMQFDNDSTNWYYGDSGIPSGFYMISGVSGHEFGHAAGGWDEVSDGSDIGHYDSVNTPNLCGSSVPLSDRHTMCAVNQFIGTNLEGSLEFHDEDLFEFHYP